MRPTLRTVRLLLAGIAVALVPAIVSPRLWPLWLIYLGACLLAWAADAVLALPRRRLAITVEPPALIHIGEPEPMRLALRGRDYVLPDDVKELVIPALRHRVVLAPGAEIEGLSAESVLRQLLDQIPVPR